MWGMLRKKQVWVTPSHNPLMRIYLVLVLDRAFPILI